MGKKAFIAPRVKTRRKNINTRPGISNSHARNTGHSIKLLTRNRYRFVAFFATRTLNISHAPLKWLACTFFYFPLCFMFYRRSMPTTCFRGLIERDFDLSAFPPIFQIINFHFIYNQLIKFKLNPFDERWPFRVLTASRSRCDWTVCGKRLHSLTEGKAEKIFPLEPRSSDRESLSCERAAAVISFSLIARMLQLEWKYFGSLFCFIKGFFPAGETFRWHSGKLKLKLRHTENILRALSLICKRTFKESFIK